MNSRQLLLVSSELAPRGAGIGVYVAQLAKSLEPLGWECWVATWGDFLEVDIRSRVIRIPFVSLPLFGDALFAAQLRTAMKTAKLRNPVINVHTPYPPALVKADVSTFHIVVRQVLREGKFTGRKRLEYKLAMPILTHSERRLLNAELVCSVSNAVATQLTREYRIFRKMNVVGNAVDHSHFRPGTKSAYPRVLFVGRLELNKGILDFVEMAQRVHARLPSATFHIVGRGPAKSMVINEVSRRRLGDCLTVMGFVSDTELLSEYQAAWVYVLPSHFEGLPTSVIEAMSCATPVVVSDIPSNRELVLPSDGCLTAPGDVEGLTELVMWTLLNPTEASEKARRARDRVLQECTWTAVALKYDKALRDYSPSQQL